MFSSFFFFFQACLKTYPPLSGFLPPAGEQQVERAWHGSWRFNRGGKDGGQRSLLSVQASWERVFKAWSLSREANKGRQNVMKCCKGYRNWGECVRLLTRKWLMRRRKSPGCVSLQMMSAVEWRNRNTIWPQIGFLSRWPPQTNAENYTLTCTVLYFLSVPQTGKDKYIQRPVEQLVFILSQLSWWFTSVSSSSFSYQHLIHYKWF